MKLGRKFLRLYFALEIAKSSSRLDQLYLGQKKKTERRIAPPELERTFMLNLSRFMLSIIAVLQERLDISTHPPVVSSSEEIDSLLFLIDRYVHVELQVDERLNIREHLSRQIAAEVHHQLTRPYNRDHLLHVIDVFLLGHLLLNTNICWIQGDEIPLVEHLVKLASRKKSDEAHPMLKEEWVQNWAVASLLHDIGYQIGDGKNLSKAREIWNKYFELTGPVYPSWLKLKCKENDVPGPQSDNSHLDFISSLAEKARELPNLAGCIPNTETSTLCDHGVLSALRVIQVLCHADFQGKTNEKPDNMKLAIRFGHAIHAMAHHNLFPYRVNFDANPLSCLLRLCDELQEWDRHRVNIEKVVKRLYLDLQRGGFEEFQTYEMFEVFKANLCLEPTPKEGFPESAKVSLPKHEKWLKFVLIYHDPTVAHFDPTMTLLGKAYNIQHIDLTVPDQGHNDLKFSIDLRFPSPREYGNMTEYDIYGLFTQEIRSLPLLRDFNSIEEAEPGLIRVKKSARPREDRFGIILTRSADPENRHGWLSLDPGNLFEKFKIFKNDILPPTKGR